MRIWQKLFRRQANQAQLRSSICLDLEMPYRDFLQSLARQARKSPEQVAGDMLQEALYARQEAERGLSCWRMLSPREQEIAALACLSYTNRQIATRLGISPETVKTHLHNLLIKFNLRTKAELRQALIAWDFRSWR